MKRFYIHEIDRDYNSWTGSVIMNFPSKEEADKYCEEQSWTGHYYFAEEISNENLQMPRRSRESLGSDS